MPKASIIGLAFIMCLTLPLSSSARSQDVREYKVIKGDTLWDISKAKLNDPFLWLRIWKENPEIANPDRIYPDQMIRIPLSVMQKEEQGEKAAPKSESASQESPVSEKQRNQAIETETTPKPASSSPCQEPAVVSEPLYKGIKGIVLYNGTVIEGQIITMNAETVKIRTKDEKVMSYSFLKEVAYFIKE